MATDIEHFIAGLMPFMAGTYAASAPSPEYAFFMVMGMTIAGTLAGYHIGREQGVKAGQGMEDPDA